MPNSYRWVADPLTDQSPYVSCPVSTQRMKAPSVTDYHIAWDAELQRYFCYHLRPFDAFWFWGIGQTKEQAYASCVNRLHSYLLKKVVGLGNLLKDDLEEVVDANGDSLMVLKYNVAELTRPFQVTTQASKLN